MIDETPDGRVGAGHGALAVVAVGSARVRGPVDIGEIDDGEIGLGRRHEREEGVHRLGVEAVAGDGIAPGRRGLLGGWLAALGVRLPFTTAGAVVAETFVAMPFVVLATEAGLRSLDPRYEEAAATLGARPWSVFRRVTLPLLAPSLGAGAALCWARALGEFGATITFAGNLPGRTQTMPLAVYVALESQPDGAVALSLLLVAVSVVVLVLLRRRLFPA